MTTRAPTVLHCIPTMSGGGAERQLAYLARELSTLGWAVHVALWRRGPNWDRLERSGARLHELTGRSAYDVRLFAALRRVMAEVKPDIVQTWLLQMDVLGGAAALVARTPWIFSERSSADAYPVNVKNAVRNRLAAYATAVVSNSRAGDAYWQARLGPRVRRYMVANALPLDEIAATPPAGSASGHADSGGPLVVFAGRLATEKNIPTLLAALPLVWARHTARVWCFGDGPLKASVDQWAAALPQGTGFRAMGYTTELWGVMKQAAVVVSPSLFEGTPNVVLEAMACGAPLVVSDIPAHRELLDADSAVFVDPTSAVALADAIDGVLRDPAGAARRAQAAAVRAAEFGLGTIARRYDHLYREVLSARSVD